MREAIRFSTRSGAKVKLHVHLGVVVLTIEDGRDAGRIVDLQPEVAVDVANALVRLASEALRLDSLTLTSRGAP